MNSNTRHILTLCITTLLMFGLFAAILPLSFGIGEELAWHEQIMANTTFNNLADPGETLLIVYEANGNYSNGVIDTHNYLIYRIDEAGLRDLQAHIELAKVGNNTYQMEIYHSVPNWKFSFEMPYTHTVQIETRYLITLIIEAILNPASTPTGFFMTNGTTDSNPGGLEWHEQIMANTSFYGLIRFSEGETRVTYYAGNGTYENGISDVHYYLIYRVNDDGLRDVQARIELAKLGDTTYLMEVYHSWKPVYVDMPYEHDVGYYEFKVDYFMKVTIEAIL